jgi:protein-disulfide isomerase
MPQIEKEYVETGKLKHVFMDFPLPMHGNAMKAAEAGLCAGDQGKFWEMHDKLFANSQALVQESLFKYAESLGLNMTKFKECLDSGKHAEEIKSRKAEGQKAGITGTPAFLLGFIEPDGKVKATKKVVGAQPYASFKAAIDELLTPPKK